MSDSKEPTPSKAGPDEGAPPNAVADRKPPAHDEAAPEKGPDQPDAPDLLASVQQERDELHDRLLRTMADYQNYARRAEQNIIHAREQSLMATAKQLVTVLDHFDHAVQIDHETTSTEDLLRGVIMVRDELLKTLQNLGIERLDVQVGTPFDPIRHEAMMRQPSDEVESNHITVQLQPGYMLGDKTVRPAKVSVAE